ALDVSYTFIDGRFAGSDDLDPDDRLPSGVVAPALTPNQVRPGMTLDELSAIVGRPPFTQTSLPNGVVAAGELYDFPGVIAGFVDGRLVYIETVPYLADAGGSARDALPARLPSVSSGRLATLARYVRPAAAASRSRWETATRPGSVSAATTAGGFGGLLSGAW